MLLYAEDGGLPKNTGSMEVVVKVIDANDNAPVFNQSEYFLEPIKESTSIGSILLRVWPLNQLILTTRFSLNYSTKFETNQGFSKLFYFHFYILNKK